MNTKQPFTEQPTNPQETAMVSHSTQHNTTVTIIPAEPGWWVRPRGDTLRRVIAWQVRCLGTYESADVFVKAITVKGPSMSQAVYGPSKTVALVAMDDHIDFGVDL